MSHDIRTPMNAILGMAAVAEGYLEDKAKVADCLSTVSYTHLDLHKVNNLTVHGFQQCMEGEIIPITGKKLCMKVTV